MKKLLSFILALTILLAVPVFALADEPDVPETPQEAQSASEPPPGGEGEDVPPPETESGAEAENTSDGEAPASDAPESGEAPAGEPETPPEPARLYQFDDVTPDRWYYEPVMYLYDNGSVIGKELHRFGADDPMTVEQTIVILSRVLLGTVSQDTWERTVSAARDTLIGKGIISADAFPAAVMAADMTRYQLAEIVSGYLAFTGYRVDGTILSFLYSFTDLDEQYRDAVNSSYVAGVMIGTGNGLFSGRKSLTRAEGAMTLYRLLSERMRVDYTGFRDYNKLLGSFVTTFDASNTNRTFNIKKAADTLSGTVLAPGQQFSFNRTVGNANKENGYKIAGVISGGRSVQDYGGGVCQAATTLYNAAFSADLKIIERHAHGLRSSYVQAGMDSTIAYGTFDLKFSNPYSRSIKLFSYVAGNAVFAGVYAPSDVTAPAVTYNITRSGRTYTTCRYADGVNDFTTVSNYS